LRLENAVTLITFEANASGQLSDGRSLQIAYHQCRSKPSFNQDRVQVIDGLVEKVWLPDGSLFISAGRIDWMTHPGMFVLSADKGYPGNIAGFCAALAPYREPSIDRARCDTAPYLPTKEIHNAPTKVFASQINPGVLAGHHSPVEPHTKRPPMFAWRALGMFRFTPVQTCPLPITKNGW
jgi:hypothetical protein